MTSPFGYCIILSSIFLNIAQCGSVEKATHPKHSTDIHINVLRDLFQWLNFRIFEMRKDLDACINGELNFQRRRLM